MKQTNVKTALMFSLLALVGCKDKGGGNSNPTPVAVPGVIAQVYNVAQGETCNMGTNSYTCTQYGMYGQPAQTVDIGFDSMMGLCNVLMNDQANRGIARQTRQVIYQQQNCMNGGIVNNGMCGINMVMINGQCVMQNGLQNGLQNGINTGINHPDMKNVVCQLEVKRNNTIGDTGLMNVQVIANNASGVNMFAFTNTQYQKKFLGIFNVSGNVSSHSEKLAKVKMYYTTSAGKADMIKLEAIGVDGNLSASVTGYAGSETALEIAPEVEVDDVTKLLVTCKSNQATSAGNMASLKSYRCKGEEKSGSTVTKIDYASPYNEDIMNQTYDLGKSAKLRTEGSLSTDAGVVSYGQFANHSTELSVMTKANVTTPSAISVRRNGYRLDVKCEPSAL